jgi:hypothetical protein
LWRTVRLIGRPQRPFRRAYRDARQRTLLICSARLTFGIPYNPGSAHQRAGTGGDRVPAISRERRKRCHTYGEIRPFVIQM